MKTRTQPASQPLRNEHPLVSIVTPVLNGARYLEECFRSVHDQSYRNIEQIFVDGGSTDGTLGMLSALRSRYPERVRFVSEPDRGVGDALNKGLKMARGDIFGWLDSDDVYEEGAIQAVVDFFRRNPDAHFVFGGCVDMNESGEVIRRRPVKDWDPEEAINDRHYIVICAAFYRRQVVEAVGHFNSLGNDLDFWIRAGRRFELHRIGRTLSRWRLHGASITTAGTARNRQMDRRRFREDFVLCRQNGGSIFAPRCRRYYGFWLLDKLGLYYPFNFAVMPRLRRSPLLNRALRALGV